MQLKASIFLLFLMVLSLCGLAQDLKTTVGDNKLLDSLRKKQENGTDSIVFNSKYIRYTTLALSKDSVQTLPLDTSLKDFQNFSPLIQPRRPFSGLGNLGLPAKTLLFEPLKSIGFDAGFHSLDTYQLTHEDIVFYRARTPFTSLYYVNAGEPEQIFKLTISQNIKKNWNAGFNYNRIGANGFYARQRGDDLGASIFSWYQSPNNRYNLFATAVFNTLKAQENGSLTNDTIFNGNAIDIDRMAESVRLQAANQLYRKNSVALRNTYFIGRIDSVVTDGVVKILPTNKISYNFIYNRNTYIFNKSGVDDNTVLPLGFSDVFAATPTGFTKDSTRVSQLRNEFFYSFFLRPRSGSFLKNELKIDAGIRHDIYQYTQASLFQNNSELYRYETNFTNLTLLGTASYKFSNKIDLNVNVEQIVQGRNFGDFLYQAKSNVFLSKSIGTITLGAYLQNKSPEQVFERHFSNHYQWNFNFDRTKVLNFSAGYLNEKLKLDAGLEYFLTGNYLYFVKNGLTNILPAQETADISLLRLTLGKRFVLGKFNLELYGAYQKTDNASIIRTPEFYTFNTFYFSNTFFKTLKTQLGVDVRYNSTYAAYSYSPAASQFYNGDPVVLGSKPILAVWVKASLRKANVFVKYDYMDQGLFNNGFYTTNLYPMGDRSFKFGVLWNFYD